ncbi:MAG: DUF2231 domain-containing protein [Aquificae bacterium]|nr:DUF2231 domain-containing protein [Aquificota bacterium]
MEFLAQFHPPIVHFAVALVITSVIFDILGTILNKNSLKQAGFWTMVGGVIAMFGAFVTGVQAEEVVEEFIEGTVAYELLEKHEELGELLPWIVLLIGGFRVFIQIKQIYKLFLIYLVVAVLTAIAVGYQGRIGGKLVYDYGVGVKCDKTPSKVYKYKHDDDD